MHIYMVSQHLQLQVIVQELFQVEMKEKLGFGKSDNIHKQWKPLWKSTEVKFGLFRWEKIMNHALVPVRMVPVLSGILKNSKEICVFLNKHFSNKYYIILRKANYWQLVQIERSHTGPHLTIKELLECWMDQMRPMVVKSMLWQSQKKENISFQEVKIN